MPKSKIFVLGASSLVFALSVGACSSGGDSSPDTTTTTTALLSLPTTTVAPTTTLPPESTTTTTTISATATDWEVVVGIFTTEVKAQAQIDKLTAAKFVPFSIKPVDGKFAVVLPGLVHQAARAMVFQINEAKVGSARVFHLTGDSATNFEVVAGIYTTSAKAQAQIDKLTAADFAGFSIKPVTGKFAVVLPGLTNSVASAMVTKINAAGLGPSRVKQLL